jgi:hypothetical protein
VLPAHGYCIPQGVVIDEYGIIVELVLERESQRNSEKILFQCHFVHHESHMKIPGGGGVPS